MLALCLVLVLFVLFVVFRNVLLSLLIYYGYLQERGEPTYPLTWFAYKTKIKRLTQHRIVRYRHYEPSLTETEEGNQCCFCLELLRERSTVAELYCGHEFHKECFNEWIKSEPNTRCPTCRRAFTRAAVEAYEQGYGSNQELPL
jgi:hypothetical protein